MTKYAHFGVALCKCGVDMVDHIDFFDEEDKSTFTHPFTASGTKYRCEEYLDNGFFCALPRTHVANGLPHGPVLGESWIDNA